MSTSDRFKELREILEAIFENRLTPNQAERLDELTVLDAKARRFYLEYINLHGNLHWDVSQGNVAPQDVAASHDTSTSLETLFSLAVIGQPEKHSAVVPDPRPGSLPKIMLRRRGPGESKLSATEIALPVLGFWALRNAQFKFRSAAAFVLAAAAFAAVVAWQTCTVREPQNQQLRRAVAPDQKSNPLPARVSPAADSHVAIGRLAVKAAEAAKLAETTTTRRSETHAKIVVSSDPQQANTITSTQEAPPPVRADRMPLGGPPASQPSNLSATRLPQTASTSLVAFIDHRIQSGWKNAGIEPSPIASDGEWLRRVYLDLIGHIPGEEAVNRFLADPSSQKRAAVVDVLLKRGHFARNWSTLWVNLLIGRRPQNAGISRESLEKFLRDSFVANVGWNEIVYELVSAEGAADQNPAANFLLAHLNNEAVPATALTARLFLGIQVQCTQCHDHPFHQDKQSNFWELNSFFQQTEMVTHSLAGVGMEGATGQMSTAPELITRKVGGPQYYETLRGVMKAAYPIYARQKVDPGPEVNRRRELGRLIARGTDRQLALAMVNRTWQHFFGYAFTRPVDDMGPHNPPSHPEVLDRLADEFIASDYNLKRLVRVICSTEAYQRSSVLKETNRADNPATGATPLFSRVYLKPMTAEQLYDSLLVATRAKSSARTDWNDVGRRRPDWVSQFVICYGTDENDETTTLAGSISQALVMMNDPIVKRALAVEPGTLLYDVVHDTMGRENKIRRLCRAALSRNPTPAELDAGLEDLQSRRGAAKSDNARQQAESQALEDIFWAFLNSNEFAIGH